jgi:Berberine and berberine like
VTFTPWDGAYNRVPADATAVVHRHELFLVQYLLFTDPADTIGYESGPGWLARSWALVHPWGSGGVYPNFPDLEGWAHAYHGKNYDRLLRIKARYDPGGFFRFPNRSRGDAFGAHRKPVSRFRRRDVQTTS